MDYESSESTKSNHRLRFIAYFGRFSSAAAGTTFTGLRFFIIQKFIRIFFIDTPKKQNYLHCMSEFTLPNKLKKSSNKKSFSANSLMSD